MIASALLLVLLPRVGIRPQAVPVVSERPLVAEKKWAVCVGAGAYKDLAPLKFAPSDAQSFAKALEDGYGFEPSTVGLISDGAGSAKRPTSATILGELDRLLTDRRLDRGDLFVFYFSGHGIGTAKGDYLMPTDVLETEAESRAIPVKTLIERFVRAGLKNVLVVADACRSGAKNPFGRELQELGRKANIAVLLGCAPGQRSYEYPRLEKGVFTHFLVRAMTDRTLADKGSGALWASAVARTVATNVKEYTEADYGDEAQVPAVWTDPAQDVLMAAYPPEGEEAKGWLQESIRIQGSGLKREPYGRYLSAMGQVLAGQGRQAEAIESFKTLDGLGLATWRDLAHLGLALGRESRAAEVGSLVARAVREPTPNDLTEFLIVQGEPDLVGSARYDRAVETISRPESYGFDGAHILVTLASQRLGWSDARLGKALAKYVPIVLPGSLQAKYLAAYIALGEERYAEALVLAKKAVAAPGGEEFRADLRGLRLRVAEATKNEPAVIAVVTEGEADPSDPFPWALRRLKKLKSNEDPGFVGAAQAFAAKTENISQFGEALALLDRNAGTLLSDAERLVTRYPLSWEAALNLWLARSAKNGFLPVDPIPEAALKYGPDRPTVIQTAFFRYGQLVETSREGGRIPGWRAASIQGDVVGNFASYRKEIADDPRALVTMGLALLRSTQVVRQSRFLTEILWPLAKETTYARRETTLTSLYLALNTANEPLVREIFSSAERQGFLSPGSIMRYAIHQALIGDAKESERALGLWKTAGGESTNRRMREYPVATRALLAARRGDKVEVERLLKTLERADETSGPLAYLALYEAIGRREIGKPLLSAITNPVVEYADVHLALIGSALAGLKGDKSPTGKESLALMSSLMTQYPGHPWIAGIGFNDAYDYASFAGNFVWKGSAYDGVGSEPVTLRLEFSKFGFARGIVALEGSGETYTISGSIDQFGNLDAPLANAKGRPVAELLMKVPTRGFERLAPSLKTYVFRAEMIGDVWNALQFDLTLVESKPLPPEPPKPKPAVKTAPKKSTPKKSTPKKTGGSRRG